MEHIAAVITSREFMGVMLVFILVTLTVSACRLVRAKTLTTPQAVVIIAMVAALVGFYLFVLFFK